MTHARPVATFDYVRDVTCRCKHRIDHHVQAAFENGAAIGFAIVGMGDAIRQAEDERVMVAWEASIKQAEHEADERRERRRREEHEAMRFDR